MAVIVPTSPPPWKIVPGPAAAVGRGSNPYSLATARDDYGGRRWQWSVEYRPLKRAEAAPIVGALLQAIAGAETIVIGDPAGSQPRGGATAGTATAAKGDAAVGLDLDGTLKVGDYVQAGSGEQQRLYMLLEDHPGGTATVKVYPTVRETLVTAAVTLIDTAGVFELVGPEVPWQVRMPGPRWLIAFEAQEAF